MEQEVYLGRRIPTLIREETARSVSDHDEPLSWAVEGLGSIYLMPPDKLWVERRGEQGEGSRFSFDPSSEQSLRRAISDCLQKLRNDSL